MRGREGGGSDRGREGGKEGGSERETDKSWVEKFLVKKMYLGDRHIQELLLHIHFSKIERELHLPKTYYKPYANDWLRKTL